MNPEHGNYINTNQECHGNSLIRFQSSILHPCSQFSTVRARSEEFNWMCVEWLNKDVDHGCNSWHPGWFGDVPSGGRPSGVGSIHSWGKELKESKIWFILLHQYVFIKVSVIKNGHSINVFSLFVLDFNFNKRNYVALMLNFFVIFCIFQIHINRICPWEKLYRICFRELSFCR